MSGEKNYRKPSSREEDSFQEDGISRSKATGITVLIAALLLLQAGMFIWEKCGNPQGTPEEFPGGLRESMSGNDRTHAAGKFPPGVSPYPKAGKRPAERFEFDPNTISLEELCRLGFSSRQAQTILNYRLKGGIYRRREDFARMYVVSGELYRELEPWIVISSRDSSGNAVRRRLPESTQAEKAGSVRAIPEGTVPGQMLPGKAAAGGRLSGNSGPEELSGNEFENIPQKNFRRKIPAQKPHTRPGYKSEGENPAAGHFAEAGKLLDIKVDLNTADSAALVMLRGIGTYYARKILAYRRRLGSFVFAEQVMEIPGIDTARFRLFEDQICLHPQYIRRFSLDTAGWNFMSRHPYIGPYTARGIILYRQTVGGEKCTPEGLVKEHILTREQAARLRKVVLPE